MKSSPLHQQLKSLISRAHPSDSVARQYQERLKLGQLTRDENPETHFCVYFAAFDPETQEVFIGHHKKANLLLFTGGHIDQGETLEKAVVREVWEEWGQRMPLRAVPVPSLFTITHVVAVHIACKIHYDIWHFFPVGKKTFVVDQKKIATEFHRIRWMNIQEAKHLVTDPSTMNALQHLQFPRFARTRLSFVS